jgi:preprotein translocase subunit YajC
MKRFMRFFSPDEGGGAGVDAPPAPGPSTGVKKMGDAFRESMAQNSPEYKEEVDQNAASKARKAAAAAAKAPADPPPAPAKEEKKEEAAPTEDKKEKAKKGALDAATDIAAPPAATGDEPAEADPLKDLPEKLPTEGKGDHWEKARGTISSQHKAIGELGTQVKALQKQLDESKSGPPDLQKKLEEVTNELNQYRDAMVELNVEYDPGFRNKYIKGRTSLVEKAAGKVKAYGGDPAAFADAMGMREGRSRNEAIKQALTEMDEGDRVRIQTLVTDIEKLDDEANEQRANSQQSWEKLQQQRKVEAEQKKTESEQFKRTIFDKVLTSLGLTVLPSNWPSPV